MNDDKDGCMAYVILTAIGLFAFLFFLQMEGLTSAPVVAGVPVVLW